MERLLCARLLAEGFACLYQDLNPGLAVNSISALHLRCTGFMGGAQSRSRTSLACPGAVAGESRLRKHPVSGLQSNLPGCGCCHPTHGNLECHT